MATAYQQQAYYASPQPGPQQPVVQLMPASNPPPANRNKRRGFAHNSARRCGIVQIFCGLISIGTEAAMFYFCTRLYYMGTGFWAGLMFLITGSVAVRSAHKKSNCLIVSSMVLCIFALFIAGAQGVIGCFGFSFELSHGDPEDEYYGYDILGYCDESYKLKYAWQIRLGLEGSLMSIAVVEFIVAIIQSIISCAGICCGEKHREQVVVYVPHQQQGEIPYAQPPPQPQAYPGPYPGARPSLPSAVAQPLLPHPGPSDRPGSVALPLDAMAPPINPEYSGMEPPPYDLRSGKM